MTEFPEPSSDTRPPTMSEPPVSTLEETPIPRIQTPIPKRNRWQRSRCPQRPIGKDHSLGFQLSKGAVTASHHLLKRFCFDPLSSMLNPKWEIWPQVQVQPFLQFQSCRHQKIPPQREPQLQCLAQMPKRKILGRTVKNQFQGIVMPIIHALFKEIGLQVPITETRFGDAFEMGTTHGIQSNFSST